MTTLAEPISADCSGLPRMLTAHIRELVDVVEVGTPLQIQG